MNNDDHSLIKINLNGEDNPTFTINGVEIYLPGPWQFRLAVSIVLVIVSIYSFIWISEDAQRRGKSGCLAFFFALAACWPFSLLWWLWLRPPIQKSPPPALPSAPPPPELP